jgi:hypothetical protein
MRTATRQVETTKNAMMAASLVPDDKCDKADSGRMACINFVVAAQVETSTPTEPLAVVAMAQVPSSKGSNTNKECSRLYFAMSGVCNLSLPWAGGPLTLGGCQPTLKH